MSFDGSFETGDFFAVMIGNRVDEGKKKQSSLLGSQGNRGLLSCPKQHSPEGAKSEGTKEVMLVFPASISDLVSFRDRRKLDWLR